MIRASALCLLTICMALSCAEVKSTHQFSPLPSAIPTVRITNDTSATALKISMLNIKTTIAANIATTTFDVHFYNPNDKILEGELEFPLANGQHIIRYALDMNGSLREGVVVEKAKTRVAFETTVRRGIDPGLVEKTKGNNFRTRIYPLPAKGYRRIVIATEETLEQEKNDLLYSLPLVYDQGAIDSFSVRISVLKESGEPQIDKNGMILKFSNEENDYVAEHHENNFFADKTIAFTLPGSEQSNDMVLSETHNDQTYFYVNSRIEPQHKGKKKPATVGILWDISSSGEKRNVIKESDLLKQYFAKLGNVSASLIPFNIYLQTKEDFSISGGNTNRLLKKLETLDYDGGTQFGSIDLSKYSFDEVLLFSDGLSTFGKEDIILGNSPVTTITTSPSANYSYLKYIALQSHGSFIDLGKLETAVALKELEGSSLQLINVQFNKSEIEDFVTQTNPVLNNGFSFAGKLITASADVTIELGFGNDVMIKKTYTISKDDGNSYDHVKNTWAGLKISKLDMEYEKNKEEITKLGKEFSIVTQNTSLIVLDRVEDYVEHEIVPPAELQKEYYTLLKEKQEAKKNQQGVAFNEALDEMNLMKEWWNKKFEVKRINKKNSILVPETDSLIISEVRLEGLVTLNTTVPVNGAFSYNFSTPTVTTDSTGYSSNNSSSYMMLEEAKTMTTTAPFLAMDADGRTDQYEWKPKPEKPNDKSEIELNEWKPDATYLKVLEQASAKERFSKYLSIKKQYTNQPSFFVDVARFFIEKNEKNTGILVLSNISEMKLEDAELFRIVANQLMNAGEKDLAIETFEQILKIREEDPQSYRDLALAYNETGEHNKAVELLYRLITGIWDDRFGDVKAIALNEMNAIISVHKGIVNTSGIDQRLIYAMPVDVRIVIGWNADNSDIDLWVTDPNKEKCSYEHTETIIGGKISRDVTQGYGPEEFLLKKALSGNYIVDVNLFGDHRQTLGGPITIKADMFTDFGKPTQKRKTINLRVTTDKEVINLGSLKFGT